MRARLTELLGKYGSQSELARELKISQQSISKILQGGPAGLFIATKLATHLRISREAILMGEAAPSFPLPPAKRAKTLAQAVARFPGRWDEHVVSLVEEHFQRRPPDGWESALEAAATGQLPPASPQPEKSR